MFRSCIIPSTQEDIEIVFTVYDLDGTTTIEPQSDVVDNILIHPVTYSVPSASDPFSAPMNYSGTYSHVQLAFRLTCDPPLYGPNCIFCVDSNDTYGHYYCDSLTGEKICHHGYQNPLTNCTECKPALNCGVWLISDTMYIYIETVEKVRIGIWHQTGHRSIIISPH